VVEQIVKLEALVELVEFIILEEHLVQVQLQAHLEHPDLVVVME